MSMRANKLWVIGNQGKQGQRQTGSKANRVKGKQTNLFYELLSHCPYEEKAMISFQCLLKLFVPFK